jgi:peptide/nickel transport system substrate-binding protein
MIRRITLRACSALLCLSTAFALPAFGQDHQGGKLRLLSASASGTLDPQVNYTLKFAQLFVSVYDGLVTFKKAAGDASFEVVPDLAESIPKPTDNDKTFTFVLRRGIHFSDGKEVDVDDVAASFRRIFKVLSPTAGTFYNLIVGADACTKTPATCTLAGGVVVDKKTNTVTFHLTKPDPEFLYKLAFGHAIILPASAPVRDAGITPIAGTGPFMFVSYDPKKQLKLLRNPNFKVWNKDAQPEAYLDEIDYDFGLTQEDQVTAVANGQADWTFDDIPADRLNELGTKYASQVHISPLTAFAYVAMNSRLAPFDNLKVRQAVNLAIDRNATVKLHGGANLATVTCQILPPGLAGYQPYCPWTKSPGEKWSAPDLERARQLVKESGTMGQKVVFIAPDTATGRAIGTYMQSVLTDLGYDVSLKVIAEGIEFTYIQNTNNKVQISSTDWYQDYPSPSDFLGILFSCSAYHPGSDASINIAGVCDPALDKIMTQALDLTLSDPKASAKLWADADKKVVDAAYFAPLYNPKHVDFISKRVKNFVFSAETYFIPAVAWVQ